MEGGDDVFCIGYMAAHRGKPAKWYLYQRQGTISETLYRSESLAEIAVLFRYFSGLGTNEERLEAVELLKTLSE